MAKEKKQDCGWQFPKALEIVKCKEGNKEFMKERPARRPFGNTVLICEYPLDGDFNAIDCPRCGCQIALAIRVPRVDLSPIAERDDADESEVAEDED